LPFKIDLSCHPIVHEVVNLLMAAVDGGWSEWSVWDECSATCGQGQRSRTRECNNPTPAYGGRMCDGDSRDLDTCNVRPCPGKITLSR